MRVLLPGVCAAALVLSVAPDLAAQPTDPSRSIRFVTRDGTFGCGATVDSIVGDTVFVRRERFEPAVAVAWGTVVAAWEGQGHPGRPQEGNARRRMWRGALFGVGTGVVFGTSVAQLLGWQRGGFRDYPGIIAVFAALGAAEGLLVGALLPGGAADSREAWTALPVRHASPLSTTDEQRVVELKQRCLEH